MPEWVNGKNSRQCGFDVGLWPRDIVCEVGEAAILYALESIGRAVRARPSLTPQKPLQHALATRSRRDGDEGKIYFLGESGVRVNAVCGSWNGSRRTCALLLRLQVTVDGNQGGLVKTFASTQNLPERVLFIAQPGIRRMLRAMFDQL